MEREITTTTKPIKKPVPKKKLAFDIESMKNAILKCDKSIKIFEEAIEKENETKREYRRIIAVLEQQMSEYES